MTDRQKALLHAAVLAVDKARVAFVETDQEVWEELKAVTESLQSLENRLQ